MANTTNSPLTQALRRVGKSGAFEVRCTEANPRCAEKRCRANGVDRKASNMNYIFLGSHHNLYANHSYFSKFVSANVSARMFPPRDALRG